MKNKILSLLFCLSIYASNAQTELIVNGGFDTTAGTFTSWAAPFVNGNLWGGTLTSCPAYDGTKNLWLADQTQQTGVDDASEALYQTIIVPTTMDSVSLTFYGSINTTETGTTANDFLYIRLRSSTGTLLTTLGS